MASVTKATRSGRLARASRRTTAGWMWWPSAITSHVTSSRSSTAPTTPGSRWCSSGMPLNVWVAWRGPAAAGGGGPSYVAAGGAGGGAAPAGPTGPGVAGAGVDGGDGLVVRGVGVAERGDRAGGHDVPGEVERAQQLGGQGDHADRAGVEQRVELPRVGRAQRRGVLGAAAALAQPWA